MRKESGSALIIALLILLVLTLIGISSISTTTFETGIVGNERARMQAFYAAEAGIEEALNRLPSTTPLPRTELQRQSRYQPGSSYWGGGVEDKDRPQGPQFLGKAFQPGEDVSAPSFRRYRIHVTGECMGAVQELEVQVKFGQPASMDTNY